MRAFLKLLLVACVVLLSAIAALFVGTRGHYPVAPLATEDATRHAEMVAGIALHMEIVEGPVDSQTIVVLHGGPGGDFRALRGLGTLSDTHKVVFYDQRGAGLSERVEAERLTIDGYLEELDAVITLASPDQPVVLIGHSWGAMLAVAYLGQSPERVAAAVLIEPGYLDAAGRDAWVTESKAFMSGWRYNWEALLTGFRAQHVSGADPAAQDDFLVGHMVGVFADHRSNPYHCGAGYSAPDWRFGSLASGVWLQAPAAEVDRIGSSAAAFARPVLFVAGACNSWLGPLQKAHLERFTNADLAIIPNAGHHVVWDNPEAALDTIRAFLD